MAAEGEDDPEGYLLAEARKILGEAVPIVVSLDLHGVLTARMLKHADASLPTTPIRTSISARPVSVPPGCCSACWPGGSGRSRRECRIPALVRGDELITETGAFGRIVREAQAIEQGPGGLSAGMFIGNPFTDVPDLACYSRGRVPTATRSAPSARRSGWRSGSGTRRERMQARLTPLAEAVRLASRRRAGTVVLVDAADATSSGAPGDSNAILRELLAAGYAGRALVPIVDPAAVATRVRRGRRRRRSGSPSAGRSTGGTRPLELDRAGPDALGRAVPQRVVRPGVVRGADRGAPGGQRSRWWSTTRPVHLFDRSLFFAHGQDPRQFDLVVVKSPHCQRADVRRLVRRG